MILIAFSTMLSAIVINLTHYLQKNSVPRCLKIVSISRYWKPIIYQNSDRNDPEELP